MVWKLETAAVVVACMIAGPLAAQTPETGKLLVSTADIADPNYVRTVVLLLHHDENGTIGVTINRPTWVKPQAVNPELGALENYSGNVYRGGPLAPTQLIFLARDPPAGTFEMPPIVDGVYASGNLDLVAALAGGGEQALRLYAGHDEWAAGQLEQEIDAGQWVIVDGNAERVFAPDVGGLWDKVGSGGSELLVGVFGDVSPSQREGSSAASQGLH